MREKIVIEKASDEDATEIIGLIKKEFPYFSLSEEEFWERLKGNTFTVFKATMGKKFAGFVEIEFLQGNQARINGLTIKQEYRGKSAAQTLLEKALDFLKGQKAEKVKLLVKQSNEKAKQLYKKFGFEYSGLYPKKLDNDTVEEMELSLADQNPSMAA